LRPQIGREQVGPIVFEWRQFVGGIEQRGGGGRVGFGDACHRVGVRDTQAERKRPVRGQRKVQHLGAVQADKVEMTIESPVDQRVARTHAPAPFVACLYIAPREHDGDISLRVSMPSLDGPRCESLTTDQRVGETSLLHSRRA
jgi:hypothetical protein